MAIARKGKKMKDFVAFVFNDRLQQVYMFCKNGRIKREAREREERIKSRQRQVELGVKRGKTTGESDVLERQTLDNERQCSSFTRTGWKGDGWKSRGKMRESPLYDFYFLSQQERGSSAQNKENYTRNVKRLKSSKQSLWKGESKVTKGTVTCLGRLRGHSRLRFMNT